MGGSVHLQEANFCFLLWGGMHNYLNNWWSPLFNRSHNLLDLISVGLVAMWLRQGKQGNSSPEWMPLFLRVRFDKGYGW